MKIFVCVVAVALMLAGTGVRAQQATSSPYKAFDPGAPVHYPRSRAFHVQNYKLELTLDFDNNTISGVDYVTMQPFAADLTDVVLDSGDLNINSVTLGGKPLEFHAGSEHLDVTLDHRYSRTDTLTLAITYHGAPKNGLYFVHHSDAAPGKFDQVWSQGEQNTNHYWFPCYDFPNDKATSELVATVPSGWVAIANGQLVSKKQGPDGAETFDWVEHVPHSTYLTSLVAGPFKEFEQTEAGKPVTYYVGPNVDQDTALRSFGLTPDMIAVYTRLLGVPYPYEKYSQCAVQDFVAGGMENISATTQTALTLHNAEAEREHYSSQSLVAHELAHQWFGDLVTTEDWANIWLNEGFATFMEAQYTLEHGGADEYAWEIWDNGQTYKAEDRDRYRRPIVDRRYVDDFHMFDATTYQKGSVVLDMLTYVLGRDQLFRGLNHYLNLHKGQNVTTADLIEALDQASGQNLEWFFDEWVFGAGYPEYKVTAGWDADQKVERVTVEQTQSLTEGTPLFTMPVDISITTESTSKTYRVTVGGQRQEFVFSADSRPLMVLFDSGNHILKSLDFDKTEDELVYQADHDPSLVGRIWAVRELGRKFAGQLSVNTLAGALARDKFWAVRIEAAQALGGMKSQDALPALIAAPHGEDARVRAAVVAAIGNFEGDQRAIAAAKAAYTSDDSYRARAEALLSLARLKSPDAFDVLKTAMAESSYRDVIRVNALRGMEMLGDARAIPIAADYTTPDKTDSARQAAMSLLASLGKGSDVALKALSASASDSFVRIRVAAYRALGQLGNPEAIPLLTRAQGTEMESRAGNAAAAAISAIEAASSAGRATVAGQTTPPGQSLRSEIDSLKKANEDLLKRVEKLEEERKPKLMPAANQ